MPIKRIHILLATTMLTGVAAAANEAPPSQGLEEVVVTAQRRSESLQVVPVSITSVSAQAIEDSGYQSLTDLQYLVPGLQFDPTQGSAFQIRGVGSESFDYSSEKSVSVVVDDVVMDAPRDNGLTGLDDLKRVDVLMGPQGTLFGKNSTSGVVAITTQDPVLGEVSGAAGASYGERGDTIDNLHLNLPLGQMAALRVSSFIQSQGGYGNYTSLDKKLGWFEDYGFRTKLLIQPTDDLEIMASGDWEHHWDNFIRTSAGGGPAALTGFQLAHGVTPGPENVDNADTATGSTKTDSYGGSLRVRAKIGNDTLTSITALRATGYIGNAPTDLVPHNEFAFIPYNTGTISTSKVSEELHWASPTGQFFEYFAGLFYNKLNTDSTQVQLYTGGAPLVNAKGVPLTTIYSLASPAGSSGDESSFQARNRSEAAFGQLKLNVTDQASLAFGARYTSDRNSQSLSFPFVPTPLIANGATYTVVGATAAPFQPSGAVSSHNFSYRISPEYKISDDLMAYATYSTGYKPGGVAFVSSLYDPYRDETVESWEVGVKSEWFNHRLRINADLFDETFHDFQASTLTAIPGTAFPQIVIGNAGGLKSQGAETNVTFRATDALTLNGSLTYTDAHFTDYVYSPTANYTGTMLSNSPRWMGTVGATYNQPIDADLRLLANVGYSYRSTVYTVIGDPAYSKVPGFGLLNLRLSLSTDQDALQFGVYARNLLNQYYSTGWIYNAAVGYVHYTTPDAYRTVGAFARYAF